MNMCGAPKSLGRAVEDADPGMVAPQLPGGRGGAPLLHACIRGTPATAPGSRSWLSVPSNGDGWKQAQRVDRANANHENVELSTETRPESGARSKAPVFVLGCPRSGTTLLYHMLLSAGNFAVYRAESQVFNLLEPRFGG